MQKVDIQQIQKIVNQQRPLLDILRKEVAQVVVGNEQVINNICIAVLCNGHVLLEGVPGVAKTTIIKTFAQALGLQFQRIQFTPDLLPADLIGTLIYNPQTHDFETKKGPIFSNLVLADEINRASPKTQSALLEAMQERCVTVLGVTHALPAPFFVLATQNPIELEGTYPLPEAQLDRFLFKLEVMRNSAATLEQIVMMRELGEEPAVEATMNAEEFDQVINLVRKIYLPDVVANYIARLVTATHPGESESAKFIKFGSSPRAALSLASAAKARALMNERPNASFEDVKWVAPSVLRHRVLLDYNAQVEGITVNQVIDQVIAEVPFQDQSTPKTLKSATA